MPSGELHKDAGNECISFTGETNKVCHKAKVPAARRRKKEEEEDQGDERRKGGTERFKKDDNEN